MIHKGDRYPRGLHRGTRKIHLLTKGERPIYASPEAIKKTRRMWLDANVRVTAATVHDSAGHWFELEITLPEDFDGNPTDGWDGSMADGMPDVHLSLEWSADLQSWSQGGWVTSPGSTPEDLGDGRTKWFARYETVPIIFKSALIDLTLESKRYGKTITSISNLGSVLDLGAEFEMPADHAALQTALRAEGLTDATVTTESEDWAADIQDYDFSRTLFRVVWDGDDIIEVRKRITDELLDLDYPFTMPVDAEALKTAISDEGYDYVQMMLYKDSWTIFVPDVETVGTERDFIVTIDPGDPFQTWTYFGTENEINPQTTLKADVGNIRVLGTGRVESLRGFGRLGFSPP